jgi:hypothetical protein
MYEVEGRKMSAQYTEGVEGRGIWMKWKGER